MVEVRAEQAYLALVHDVTDFELTGSVTAGAPGRAGDAEPSVVLGCCGHSRLLVVARMLHAAYNQDGS